MKYIFIKIVNSFSYLQQFINTIFIAIYQNITFDYFRARYAKAASKDVIRN